MRILCVSVCLLWQVVMASKTRIAHKHHISTKANPLVLDRDKDPDFEIHVDLEKKHVLIDASKPTEQTKRIKVSTSLPDRLEVIKDNDEKVRLKQEADAKGWAELMLKLDEKFEKLEAVKASMKRERYQYEADKSLEELEEAELEHEHEKKKKSGAYGWMVLLPFLLAFI
eukprot:Platyproteum_vivax@DN5523_c0_g1_i1.p1